jgi:hypothetical protein
MQTQLVDAEIVAKKRKMVKNASLQCLNQGF